MRQTFRPLTFRRARSGALRSLDSMPQLGFEQTAARGRESKSPSPPTRPQPETPRGGGKRLRAASGGNGGGSKIWFPSKATTLLRVHDLNSCHFGVW